MTDLRELAEKFAEMLPKHKAGLFLEHNDHKTVYQSAADRIEEMDIFDIYEWVSPEQKQKAIDTDSIWTLQWYPDTPVGFCCLAAADFSALLSALIDREGE